MHDRDDFVTPEPDFTRRLFYPMLRIRMVEEAIAERYHEQEMRCPVHLSVGQEAIAVGTSAALRDEDYVMSTHRAHAHYLARGGDLRSMLAEIYGRASGCCSGKGGSMHLVDLGVNMLGSTPIVGSSLPVAVGTAFGTWMKKGSSVTVVFFGEGTTEEGVFAECLNFAALKRLPLVFLCENNLYSVYSPMEVRQSPDRDRVRLAEAHGIAASRGDGNDVLEVHAQVAAAVDRARAGEGPTFVEFETYRWREHCGPNYDNHIGYRTEAEFQKWQARCPIKMLRDQLLAQGALTVWDLGQMEREIQDELDAAFIFARNAPPPRPEELYTDLYAEPSQ